jgi:putative transposase
MKTIKQNIRGLNKTQYIELKRMCKHSNSLYNSTLYFIKCYYKETNSYIGYNKLYHEMKTNIHYKSIPAKISQQILRLADKNYVSFFHLLKQKNNGRYADNISEPKYKKSNSEFILILPQDQVSLKKGKLKITKDLKLNYSYEIDGKIKQAIIKPNNYGYYSLYIVYEENKIDQNYNFDKNNILGIDLGINNLVTCVSNVGRSFAMNGKPLKSYNKFYNKQKSQIQSELKVCNDKHYSKKISILNKNRNNYIDNYFNQIISRIIKYSIDHNIGSIIIGYNETWKKNCNIGKVNNQTFVQIPYFLFKRKLENKCKEYGIDYIMVNESYTSKCSFLDNEEVKKQEKYLGRRIKRGLFKTSKGCLINADVNGALNITRKVFPKAFADGIEGGVVHPVMLNIFNT